MAKESQQLELIKSKSSSDESSSEQLKKRESEELVIAFSGAVGSGLKKSVEIAKQVLISEGYNVKEIRVSNLIINIAKKMSGTGIDVTVDERNKKDRYFKLQNAGNILRNLHGNEILSELVISEITVLRKAEQIEKTGNDTASTDDYTPPKTAYLINQLKHPAEVELLKTVYGDLFYLIGVLASENIRKKALIDEDLSDSEAAEVMERDRKEDMSYGQQLEKTLLLADFFIRDNHSNDKILLGKVERFIQLMHGYNGLTPTYDEYGMYSAYSASLKSACLSRQVGASITNTQGNVIATGCNDVPKSKGGLYTEVNDPDNRCVNKGECFNDKYKDKLCVEISNVLSDELKMDASQANKIAYLIKDNSRLKDLIEFSRSVHAEMDAITSVAREGGVSVKNCTLYTTTFPCHNCARHIIASGITNVIYIEPYEKSLALQLHGDDISYDPTESESESRKVVFMHFEGVSPKQYMNFFCSRGDRKDSKGKVIKNTIHPRLKVAREYLDSYRDFEKKIISNLNELGIINNE